MAMEDVLRIWGGVPLRGSVNVSGGKNAAVAIIPAALLANDVSYIENLPEIDDVYVLVEMLRELGAQVEFRDKVMRIDARTLNSYKPPLELTCRMRASYYLLGVLLGRFGRAEVPMPGGCDIGSRPIDQTIKGLRTLGVNYESNAGVMYVSSDRVTGADVYLDMPSVGATINTILPAVLAQGVTQIHNAAREPHVVDLANFLNSMGASIKGAGTDTIRIRGVRELHGTRYAIIPDQIETGTLMLAAAATHGDVEIHGVIPTHMEALTAKMLEMGIYVHSQEDMIHVRATSGRPRGLTIKTQYYPGFPTDLQQPMTALLCTSGGPSVVNETIYESRFKYAEELMRMGANIRVMDRIAIVEGVERLTGCRVHATDLRAGAALVVAALGCEGMAEISGVRYIDRGYEGMEEKLRALGARIERVQMEVG
ncbi:MAG: UDP-N-acetylglucosamine 1-carboxyvinyltransferase [Candidatus Fimadaptatus sp.]